MTLNKKQKKQLDLDQKKLAHLRSQLSGAKRQADDPLEIAGLEKQIETLTVEIERLKASQ